LFGGGGGGGKGYEKFSQISMREKNEEKV